MAEKLSVFWCSGSGSAQSVSDSQLDYSGRMRAACGACGRSFQVRARRDDDGWAYVLFPRHKSPAPREAAR